MTGKRMKQLGLITLSALAALVIGVLLLVSLTEPQISDRIELYETDLVLRATELQETGTQNPDLPKTGSESGASETKSSQPKDAQPGNVQTDQWSVLQKAVFGDENPVEQSLKSYQEVRRSAEKNLQKFEQRLQQMMPMLAGETAFNSGSENPARESSQAFAVQEIKHNISQQQELISQLDLRIGILQAQQTKVADAIATWTRLLDRSPSGAAISPPAISPPLSVLPAPTSVADTATVLIGLWSQPPRLLPDAESQIQRYLDGWFRYKALNRLYSLQQRSAQLEVLKASEREIAQDTLVKLSLLSGLQLFGGLIGAVLTIGWLVRWWLRRSPGTGQSAADGQPSLAWEVPWTWEMMLQVLLFAFILPGQLVAPLLAPLLVPILLSILGFGSDQISGRADAVRTTVYYLVMAGVGLTVLYFSLKPFFRLPKDWFRFAPKWTWVLWGVSGYFVALPLMVIVSNLNQEIWQGQGGSNPLLELVLRQQDGIAMGLFFFTAAIAAPLFEETLFRGFLLPSLTRYVPVWAAIGISGVIFALAHLSLAEVLPLTVLGCVLGFVYTRSRSLLAVMLLHSLWNSVTMLSLFVLGSSMN